MGVHYSWFVLLAVIAWVMADGNLPDRYPGWSTAAYWGGGLIAALMLFVSVLIHELAHSIVARSRGFPVAGITLFLLGGVSGLRAESGQARDELLISVAGPLSSLLLGGANWIVSVVLPEGLAPEAALLGYLWIVNLVLAVFNLLPIFPLDGGRILHAAVWGASGNLPKATGVATRVGQIGALALAGLGPVMFFHGECQTGLLLALAGLFLHSTASASRRQA